MEYAVDDCPVSLIIGWFDSSDTSTSNINRYLNDNIQMA